MVHGSAPGGWQINMAKAQANYVGQNARLPRKISWAATRGAALVGLPRLRAEDRVNGVLVSDHGTELNFAEQDSIFTPSADWDRSAAPITGRAPAAHATWWSARGLTPSLGDGTSHLGVCFALRCCQRFSRPGVATGRCSWRNNPHTSGPSAPVLSY